MAAQTTSSMSNEIMTKLSPVFLERAKYELIHDQGLQQSQKAAGEGKTTVFNRYSPLALPTTPLTEGTNPADVNLTSSTVSATVAEYGNVVRVSKLLSTTSIDQGDKEKVEVVGQNMGETLDQLVREELFTGATVRLANGRGSLSAITATDVLNAREIRLAVRDLKLAKAMTYKDGYYIGKIGPMSSQDVMSDSLWINAKQYSETKDLYQGEVGSLYGARLLETLNQKSESSTTTVYSNFFHGMNAAGVYDLDKDTPKMYIKEPGPQDTSNPTNRYATIGWAGSYVAKTLIGSWLINVKTGATA